MSCFKSLVAVLCFFGVAFSSYAIYVERAKRLDQNYEAICDLDETISCSHALLSEYSKGFGILGSIIGEDHFLNLPNSYMGLIFFPLLLILALSSSRLLLDLAFFLSLVSTFTSAYLIYVLVYVLKTICLVCMPVHMINLALFVLFTLKWRENPATGGGERIKKD